MKESIGSIPLYNIIFAFLIITFTFLAGTLAYSKAFRVSSKIISEVEVADGYNSKSIAEIHRILSTLGYRKYTTDLSKTCPKRTGVTKTISSTDSDFFYCIYEFQITIDGELHYYWGAVAFIYLDLPIVGEMVQVPIYTTSDTFYRFPKAFPIED